MKAASIGYTSTLYYISELDAKVPSKGKMHALLARDLKLPTVLYVMALNVAARQATQNMGAPLSEA